MNITQQAAAVVKKDDEQDEGFTLIELLVVVVIIGVLAAIAIPIFLSQKEKAAEAGVKSDVKSASTYAESFYVDNSTYTGFNQAYLTAEGFRSTEGVTLTLTPDNNGDGYCISGTGPTDTVFYLDSESGTVGPEACS